MKLQILLIPIILGIAGFPCVPVIEETKQVILTQFGETVGEQSRS